MDVVDEFERELEWKWEFDWKDPPADVRWVPDYFKLDAVLRRRPAVWAIVRRSAGNTGVTMKAHLGPEFEVVAHDAVCSR